MTTREEWDRNVDLFLSTIERAYQLAEVEEIAEAIDLMISTFRAQHTTDDRVTRLYLTSIEFLNAINRIVTMQQRDLMRLQAEADVAQMSIMTLHQERERFMLLTEQQGQQIADIFRLMFEGQLRDGDAGRFSYHYLSRILHLLEPMLANDTEQKPNNLLQSFAAFLRQLSDIEVSAETHPITLTPREQQVLEQLANGKTTREIGEILHLEESTVRTYRNRVKKKLNIDHLPGLVKYALRHGLTTWEG